MDGQQVTDISLCFNETTYLILKIIHLNICQLLFVVSGGGEVAEVALIARVLRARSEVNHLDRFTNESWPTNKQLYLCLTSRVTRHCSGHH